MTSRLLSTMLAVLVVVPAGVAVNWLSGPRKPGTDAVEDQSRCATMFAPIGPVRLLFALLKSNTAWPRTPGGGSNEF